VRCFAGQGGIVIDGVGELIESRHIYRVRHVGAIEGAVPSVTKLYADTREELLSPFNPFVVAKFGLEPFRQFNAVYLFEIEYRVPLREHSTSVGFVANFRRVSLGLISSPIHNG
jgi:hypothetical protein